MKEGPFDLRAGEEEGESESKNTSDIWPPAASKKRGEIFGEYCSSQLLEQRAS